MNQASMNLFTPNGAQSVQYNKIEALEQQYASPMNAIREATYSFTTSTKAVDNRQKIEDRLIELGR